MQQYMYNNRLALMCQSMVEIWSHRKVAMVGCFIASFGFLMAASTLSLHGWLIVAYSGIVGEPFIDLIRYRRERGDREIKELLIN